jgi:hypothetical protein
MRDYLLPGDNRLRRDGSTRSAEVQPLWLNDQESQSQPERRSENEQHRSGLIALGGANRLSSPRRLGRPR